VVVEPFMGKMPKVHETAFIHPMAIVIGDVEISEQVSVWPGAVIRGDMEPIRIGARSNVQDNAVIHTDYGYPTVIGKDVTIGHGCIIHGCTIGDGALIGMGAIVLSGAKVGRDSIVGAGAVVIEGQEIPNESLCVGVPAKVVRKLSDEDLKRVRDNLRAYLELARRHKGIL